MKVPVSLEDVEYGEILPSYTVGKVIGISISLPVFTSARVYP